MIAVLEMAAIILIIGLALMFIKFMLGVFK
jgi:hypothetical protein